MERSCFSKDVRDNTAKHHQVRTKIFSPHSRYVPTYGSSQTGLCNKVRPKERSVKYSKLHTKANSKFHPRMKQLELDTPYFCPNFVAKSRLGRSIRRYAPRVWRKDFGSHLVVLRCEIYSAIYHLQVALSAIPTQPQNPRLFEQKGDIKHSKARKQNLNEQNNISEKTQNALTTKCGEGSTEMPPTLTFRHYGLREELDSLKNLIIHEPSRKKTQKFQFAAPIEILQ